MARLFSNRNRPFDLGPLPLEKLPRNPAAPILEARQPQDAAPAGPECIGASIPEYRELFRQYLDGPAAPARAPVPDDLLRRAQNLKASAYFLDVTLAGACRIEPEDWLETGPPAHTHAFVFLVEFGRETKPGEAGDAWIRGSNAAKTDLRCAEVAVVMSGYIRALGWRARGHVAGDALVSIERLAQRAGLAKAVDGVLRAPFLGRGFRLGVVTTDYAFEPDLPLEVDKPIDFGLQAVCRMCLKCARECPCNAIPFGPKVMFSGYEIWKPDVEKCGRYRLTNAKGSACGRCMKTCPYNREDLVESEKLLWLSIEVPAARRALIDYDDAVGGGARNPVKRWWFDLEIVGGVAVKPAAANERDLDHGRTEKLAQAQKLAFFPPELQPKGGTTLKEVVPIDREAGLAAYAAAKRMP